MRVGLWVFLNFRENKYERFRMPLCRLVPQGQSQTRFTKIAEKPIHGIISLQNTYSGGIMDQSLTVRNQLLRKKAELKAWLANVSEDSVEIYNTVSRYRRSIALVQANGWINLVLGGFTFWLGYFNPSPSIISVGQATLGFAVAIISLFSIVKPTTKGIISFSVIFLVAGIWNLSITLIAGLRGLSPLVFGLGCVQLWWAYAFFQRYKLYNTFPRHVPTEEETRNLMYLWENLRNILAVDSGGSNVIGLKIGGRQWRGLLIADHAILIPTSQHSVLIAQRAEFTVTPTTTLNGSVNGHL